MDRQTHLLARRLVGTISFALALFGFTSSAGAVPVMYQLTIGGGIVSGSLGGVPFTNSSIVLTFYGDTSDVIPYSITGAFGAEILNGTAMIDIYDGLTDTPRSGTFLPSDGVYVSVDGKNSGIGFGAFGVLPGDPTFPGQPVYPAAEYTSTGAVTTYDLTTDFFVTGFPISCVGFPTSCAPGLPLATTAGDLVIDFFAAATTSYFRAVTQPTTPFASLAGVVEINGHGPGQSFELAGHFTLGAGSNGIDPTAEDVTLKVGPYTATIPAGSFRAWRHGTWAFGGIVAGADIEVRIVPRAAGSYRLEVEGTGVSMAGVSDPVAIALTIGDDSGTGSAALER
jgi:hypothetical protein